LVLLRDRHHEPEVRVDHPFLRLEVALLDALRDVDLLGGGEQRVAPDLVEEQLERVRRGRGQLAVAEGRGLHAGAAAVVADVDALRLDVRLEHVHVLVGQLESLNQLVQLRDVDAAALLAACDQRRHLCS
jgi:hypothetical protein